MYGYAEGMQARCNDVCRVLAEKHGITDPDWEHVHMFCLKYEVDDTRCDLRAEEIAEDYADEFS